MKKEYTKILKQLQQVFTKKRMRASGPNATRDWFVTISGTTVVAVVLCGVGVYTLFFQHQAGGAAAEPSKASELSSIHLEKTVSQYRERVNHFVNTRIDAPAAPVTGAVKPEVVSDEDVDTTEEVPAEE